MSTSDRPYLDLTMVHASLQFSDTAEQKRADVERIFKHGADILTGTESGEKPLSGLVKDAAKRYGYKVHQWRECWVAVRKDIAVKGSWVKGDVFVIDNDALRGTRGHDRGFPWLSFEHVTLGRITVAAGHYPTGGRHPGGLNYWINRKYAEALGDWARKHGKGTGIVFYGGDQNMLDNKVDTFFAEPLTSVQDELGKYPNTGHGPIDVIASYDGDRRVRAVSLRKLRRGHSDHLPIEAVYRVFYKRSAA